MSFYKNNKIKNTYLIFPANLEIVKKGFSYEVVNNKHQYITKSFTDIYRAKRMYIDKIKKIKKSNERKKVKKLLKNQIGSEL